MAAIVQSGDKQQGCLVPAFFSFVSERVAQSFKFFVNSMG